MSNVPPRHTAKPSSASGTEQALPIAVPVGVDARVVDAWVAWLRALATDAEAALAAAMAYKELDAEARDRWLGALEQDASRVNVPRIAVYAPLLAVESDPARRERIMLAIGPDDVAAKPRVSACSFSGVAPDGLRVAVVVTPLYLDFVQVLACGYRAADGFAWVKHDPIVDRRAAPGAGEQLGGVVLEKTPLKPLVDELAQAVLSHQRSGKTIPEALRVFADLFGLVPDGTAREPL